MGAPQSLSSDLREAGLPAHAVDEWLAAEPRACGEFGEDRRLYAAFWALADALIARQPKKPRRNAAGAKAAAAIRERARRSRERFLDAHVEKVYAALTHDFSRFIRVEEIVHAAAEAFPGLTPARARIEAEAETIQRDKDGLEIDQGLFLSHILGHERAGLHLCHAMLLPRPESRDALARFATDGVLDLGPAQLERKGKAVHLIAANPAYLNAEDQTTIAAMETAVDVAILDPASDVAVMRGGKVDHAKYAGQRVFGAGINLTHLYRGRIPYVWFIQRDLGFVHKFLRGVARPDALPDDVRGFGAEKPWIAAVENFAIGGHCQILLTMDYVIAASNAYLTLPARKEGIIPGAANLRLPRFVGDRLARQLVQYERRLACDSSEGRLICDEIVPPAEMDGAVERVAAGLTTSGAVGAIGNRRAFRIGEEPIDLFRRYMAVYAREQAFCHFSPALIENLERYWDAQNRKG
ncbi:MAG: enoyl-CoA hydratase/isomerase family protein [Roseiarcus sp.]|jgi:thioesterase DpgC